MKKQKNVLVALGWYPNVNTFFIAFRKAEDTTPTAFRKIARRGR
jgi:hypothetical protein